MNTEIQHGVNLGWKLASVLHLHFQPPNHELLLDSYNIERRRVGEHLFKGTDRAFGSDPAATVFLFLKNWLVP
jgi:hypothetical protein